MVQLRLGGRARSSVRRGGLAALAVTTVLAAVTRPAHAQGCDTSMNPGFVTVDGSLAEWSGPQCEWQATDPSEPGIPGGQNVLGAGYTHSTNGNFHWFFVGLGGPPQAGITYQISYTGSTGGLLTITTTCTSNTSCSSTGARNGKNIGSIPTAVSGSVIELGADIIPTSQQGQFQNSTLQVQTRSGSTTIDSLNSPLTGLYPDRFTNATAVLLTAFWYCPRSDGVHVGWETGSENRTLGFFVRRGRGGPKVSDRMTPGQLTSPIGSKYVVVDRGPGAGAAPYFLEEHADGAEHVYGPAERRCDRVATAARPPSPPGLARLPGHVAWQLPLPRRAGPEAFARIEAAGLYRLDGAALAGIGFGDRNGRASRLRLEYQGQAHPVVAVPELDTHVFLAGPVDAPDRKQDAYRILANSSTPPAARQRVLPGVSGQALASFPAHVHLEEHGAFYPSAPPELRFPWRMAFSGGPASVTFDLPGHAGGETHLVVEILGVTFDRYQPHRAVVTVNGVRLGEVRFQGVGPVAIAGIVPAGAARELANDLRLEAFAEPGTAYDMVGLVSIDASYPRALRAKDDALSFEVHGPQTVEVTGFSTTPVVLDVTDPDRPALVDGHDVVAGPDGLAAIRFRDPRAARGARAYVAAVPRAPATLTASRASEVMATAMDHVADYVAIVGPGLERALEPLLAFRRRQGLRVSSVAVQALYDRWSHGQAGPEAIRRHLHAQLMRPRYVLLVGDATFDPRDHLRTGVPDLVPTALPSTAQFQVYTAADAALVAGHDGRTPLAAVGRLPVRTEAELQALVSKLVAFETSGARSRLGIFAADGIDPITGTPDPLFRQESNRAAAAIKGLGEIIRLDVPTNTGADLMAALARGPGLVTYHGHASGFGWSTRGLLTLGDVPRLPAASPFLLITAACWDGLFAMPQGPSVSEALVLAPAGGAIASYAAASMVDQAQEGLLGSIVFPLLGNPGMRTVGDVTFAAQRALAAQTGPAADLVFVYNLLGDPATRLPWR